MNALDEVLLNVYNTYTPDMLEKVFREYCDNAGYTYNDSCWGNYKEYTMKNFGIAAEGGIFDVQYMERAYPGLKIHLCKEGQHTYLTVYSVYYGYVFRYQDGILLIPANDDLKEVISWYEGLFDMLGVKV